MKSSLFRNTVSLALFFALILTVIPAASVGAAGEVIVSTSEGGAWNNATTWVGGVVPDLVDDSVVIATTDGASVSLSGATTIKGSLTINAGSELTTGNYSLTLEGDYVNNGIFEAGSSNVIIAGTVSTQNIAGFQTFGNVSMTKTAGVATFAGNVSAAGLTLNGSGGTLNLGANTHTFTGTWTRTAGTLEGGSGTLYLGGSISGSGGTFIPGTSTFIYNGGTQNVASLTYYNLKLRNSGVKTALGAIAVNGYLRVDPTATFVVGPNNLIVMGNTYVSGTLTHDSPIGIKTYNGLVTIISGGIWKNDGTGNSDIHFRGGLLHNGATFNAGSGTYYFEDNDQSIGGISPISLANLVVEDGFTLTNNNAGLSVTNTLAGTSAPDGNGHTGGAIAQGTSGVLSIGMADSGFTLSSLDASAVGNTVNYTYSGDQVVRDIQYHSLGLGGSGAKTLPVALTHLTGNFSVGDAATVATVANLDVDGNLSVSGSAVLTVNGFNFNVDGPTAINGTSTYVNGKLLFNSVSGAKSFGGLISIGKYGIWDNTVGVPVALGGGLSFSSVKPFVAGNGLYTFQGAASQSIGGTYTLTIPNMEVAAGVDLTNANSSAEGLTVTTTLGGLGTLTQGGNSILNISVPDAQFTLSNLVASASGNTVNYNGTAQTVRPVTYHNLTLSTSGIKTLAGVTTINGNLVMSGSTSAVTEANLSIGGNLTVGGSAVFTVGPYDFTVSGATTVSGQLTHASNLGTKLYVGLVSVSGDWINSGNANVTFRGGLDGDISASGAGDGVYTFDTTPNQTIASGSAVTFKNMTVASGVTITNNGSVNVTGAFNVAGDWVQGPSSSLSIGGTYSIASLNASAVGNTVRYTSASPQAVIGGTYHHLVLSGGSVKTLPANLTTLNGNLTISSDTSTTLAADLTVVGNVTIDSGATLDVSTSNFAINLRGHWTCSTSSGALVARSGLVTLQGTVSQRLEGGDCVFNNLTLNNAAGAYLDDTSMMVNGALTLTNGMLDTGTKTLIMGSDGSIAGADATRYIRGNLKKTFAVSGSSQNFTFPIGDATAYTPVEFTVDGVSTAGTITIKTTSGEHPNISTAVGLDRYQDVNRYWTLTPATIVFSTYTATFHYLPSDLDSGADPASFVVKRCDSASVWHPTTSGVRTATSTQAISIPFTTSINVDSFAIGEGDDIPPVVTNVTSTTADGLYNGGDVISGVTVTFSEIVDVTGTPQLTLETGAVDAVLNYVSGTGSTTLVFSDYTVQAGDTSSDLNASALAFNGGTIEDMSNNAAVLTLSGTSLAANKAIVIDTTAPDTQVASGPASLTNSTSAAFEFSADESATFDCQLDGGGFAACASPYSVADGPHVLDVRAVDLAGNADGTPASHSWTVDATPPTVLSTTLMDVNPTNRATVRFSVIFSEPVTGVDVGDFTLTLATVTNASVTLVEGSGTTYTVTVKTGLGNGTIRLDVLDNDTIMDAALNPLGGSFAGNSFYTVNKTLQYQSINTNDGWTLESTATSNRGGSFNATTTTFNLGDDASRKQYRAILHFNTATLPDTAVITSVTLKIKKATGSKGNTSTLGALLVDMKKPSFGTAVLAKTDFEAAAGKSSIFDLFKIASGWYSATMKSTGFTYVNRTGTTQFRLRFTKGDDGDSLADYLVFYSGNVAAVASRPQLIINYYVP
ncbi:MAG: beta strand repeat-containing protein [Chloroflexota bacterium]